jgi:hypothetical protein
MVLAIVRKDLRETRLFAALSVGLYLVYFSKLTGKWGRVLTLFVEWIPGLDGEASDVPFVQDNFLNIYLFIGFRERLCTSCTFPWPGGPSF